MSVANPLWGAPRIHGELLKLEIDVGQTTVARYMAKRRRPPSQGWKTFLRNHADGIASIDMFVVPTISFRQLYGLLVLRHSRGELLWLGVTAHPSAEWIARYGTGFRHDLWSERQHCRGLRPEQPQDILSKLSRTALAPGLGQFRRTARAPALAHHASEVCRNSIEFVMLP
jgi:hypothetical protein